MGGVKNRMKAFLDKILRQLLNNEDDKKNTIRIISGVSEVGNERYYHWAEEHVSLCNDNSLLFRWMHLLFPICQNRINLMIRYAQHSHLFICSQQE